MAKYHFDIETTGLNSQTDKTITIQWQRLDRSTGKPIGNLFILKEWKSSEKAILKKFLLSWFKPGSPFDFIPVGKNLSFDFRFLSYRAKKYGLKGLGLEYFHDKPSVDLKPVLVMINKGGFKGYDKVIDKTGSLNKVDVPKLYREGKYSEIIKYIEKEAKIFIKAYQVLKKEMPSLIELL